MARFKIDCSKYVPPPVKPVELAYCHFVNYIVEDREILAVLGQSDLVRPLQSISTPSEKVSLRGP
jgi:hypothetical protein